MTKDLVEYSNKRGSGRGCEDVWFKLRRDDNVAGRDLRIEAVRVKRERRTRREWMAPRRLMERTVQKALMHEVPET